MSALTYEVKNPKSPVARWLRATFPHLKEVQAEFRAGAGVARVLPGKTVATGTQGAAVDWWLRMLIDPAVSLDLPLAGLMKRRVRCVPAGLDLLGQLGAVTPDRTVVPMRPAAFADRDDEWWARVCYALALCVELYRAATVEHSRLARLGTGSDVEDLLALANDDEVADLIAMRDLALERLLPALPTGVPVISGMTFEGSEDLNADGDLIVGGMLVDFKASQGGNPRADGTRAASLSRTDLDQLLGYALLDYSDSYRIHTVAVYAVRFGYLAAWPLGQLCARIAGGSVSIGALRREFARVVRSEFPKREKIG